MNQEQRTNKKIENCYQHIANYWKPDYYQKCKQEWLNIQKFIIPKNSSFGVLCVCGTRWEDKKFISTEYCVCGICDTYIQPYLSNPRNKEYVLKYIPKEYHHLIMNDVMESLL